MEIYPSSKEEFNQAFLNRKKIVSWNNNYHLIMPNVIKKIFYLLKNSKDSQNLEVIEKVIFLQKTKEAHANGIFRMTSYNLIKGTQEEITNKIINFAMSDLSAYVSPNGKKDNNYPARFLKYNFNYLNIKKMINGTGEKAENTKKEFSKGIKNKLEKLVN